MANPNGRKGSLFETSFMKWLRMVGLTAERLTKAGAKDEGDIVVIAHGKPYVLELKATKKIALPQFWDEAKIEAENYAKARNLDIVPEKYVILKRRQHGIEKAWVIEDAEQFAKRISKCQCPRD